MPAAGTDRLAETLGAGDPDQPIPGILGAFPWRQMIGQAATVKVRIVNRDFKERGLRRTLNLGHTLGHALEAWSQEFYRLARGRRGDVDPWTGWETDLFSGVA